jgi:glycosyltransferase involved in cell wall biosynthesis
LQRDQSTIPRVSVVIPTYNYARYVPEAVDSVLAQSFEELEVIVVDDGSTDKTAEILRSFGEQIRNIRQEHCGLSAARNTGIRAARGQYVAFLDSDDLWLPEKVSLQIARLDAEPEVGLVYCETLLFDDSAPATLILHSYWASHPSGRILPWLVRQNVIPSPTPIVRRELFERVGLFDETLRACEDWDMWIRIGRVCEIAYVNRVLAKYRRHQENMSLDSERLMTNGLRVLEKAFAAPDPSRQLHGLRRPVLSRWYADFGLGQFYEGRYKQARRNLIGAVTLDPRLLFYRNTAAVLSSCLVGSAAARKLRTLKKTIGRYHVSTWRSKSAPIGPTSTHSTGVQDGVSPREWGRDGE